MITIAYVKARIEEILLIRETYGIKHKNSIFEMTAPYVQFIYSLTYATEEWKNEPMFQCGRNVACQFAKKIVPLMFPI